MPILTQPDPHPKRRRPWLWVLLGVPGVVLALLVGLVAWSWEKPVLLGNVGRGISFSRTSQELAPFSSHSAAGYAWLHQPGFGWCAIKLPGGPKSGWYGVFWYWR
jgi:hypothetical protein